MEYIYLETINHIYQAIQKANSFDEAIKHSIAVVVKDLNIDYCLVWLEDVKGDSIMHPYYWIAPFDFSNIAHGMNEGSVYNVYHNQISERYLDYHGEDPISDKDFSGIEIGSMVNVPLSNKYDKLGTIQFVNRKESKRFSEDEADAFEMLATLIAIYIDEKIDVSKPLEDRTVIINVKNLIKEFKHGEIVSRVLKGINLNIYEGEFIALLGESGCGKSTLLNIIGGLDKATSGEFNFYGKDMTELSEKQLTDYRRDNIGFIFQSYNLMPNLNAKENLDFIGELSKKPMDSSEVLELVGTGKKEHSFASQLSGGQQQRVAIARAFVKRPKIVMADEPTAALDYETSVTILKAINNARKFNMTVIMVTHNKEIAKMADRIVKIRSGYTYETIINKHPLNPEELVW